MTALALAAFGTPAPVQAADPVGRCLDDALAASGWLVMATINRHDAAALRRAVEAATPVLAAVEVLAEAIAAEFAPATDAEILDEGTRLLRAWPQDRRGDKSGFGDELSRMLLKHRPGRRALAQACETLKLTKDFVPTIAEIMGAIGEADRTLRTRAVACARLPDRIAGARAALLPKPSRTAVQPRPETEPDAVASS